MSFPVLLGVGGAASTETTVNNPTNFYYDDADAYLIVKPCVELELNLMKYFRLAFGVNYRYMYDLNLDMLDKYVLNGLSGGVTFKFGMF